MNVLHALFYVFLWVAFMAATCVLTYCLFLLAELAIKLLNRK